MPRTTPAPSDAFGITARTSQAIVVQSRSMLAETDASRLSQAPNTHRLIVRMSTGGTVTIQHAELDEMIAILMRYKSLLPEEEPVPPPVEEEDIF